MNAEQFLILAETLRAYALHHGRDLNASNLFVHTMLMRAIDAGARLDPPPRAAEPAIPRAA